MAWCMLSRGKERYRDQRDFCGWVGGEGRIGKKVLALQKTGWVRELFFLITN